MAMRHCRQPLLVVGSRKCSPRSDQDQVQAMTILSILLFFTATAPVSDVCDAARIVHASNRGWALPSQVLQQCSDLDGAVVNHRKWMDDICAPEIAYYYLRKDVSAPETSPTSPSVADRNPVRSGAPA